MLIKKWLFSVMVLWLMTSCAVTQNYATVELAKNIVIMLPSPEEFGGDISVSQLITANWNNEIHTLPVHLTVSKDKVVLVGFSGWGTRILTLTYQNGEIRVDSLTGLGMLLPDSRQILLNLMLTLWPTDVWERHLAPIGWTLIDSEQYRTLLDDNGNTVAKIQYDDIQQRGVIPSRVQFNHHQQNYRISITTLN